MIRGRKSREARMDPRSDSSKRTTAKQAETYRTEAYISQGRCGPALEGVYLLLGNSLCRIEGEECIVSYLLSLGLASS